MEILVLERERHFNADSLRARFPDLVIHAATSVAQAIPLAERCEVLIALAHEVADELLAAMPQLKYVASLSAGVDHLWTLKNLRADVRITNGRGIHGPQMAEMAFLFMIGLSRSYPRMLAHQQQRIWQRWEQPVLVGKTAVIVGIGAISEALAQRCKAFEMRVVGVSDARTQVEGFDEIAPRARLKEAAAKADFLIVLVPLVPETLHMIDASVLEVMKPGAFLINLARGDVVDEAALIQALTKKRIAGAGLDVFSKEPLPQDNPLWGMQNVMITPRVGGMSDIYAQQIFPVIERNVDAWVSGRPQDMLNIVR